MEYLDRAAMWATSTGVEAASDVYGHGRDAYDGARGAVRTVDSAVSAGLDIATNTAQEGYNTVERGVAGAIPGVVDTGVGVVNGAREMVERPIDWATQRAVAGGARVANAASDAWSWMTD